MFKKIILCVLAMGAASEAFALPLPTARDQRVSFRRQSVPVNPGYNFEGIVALDNCSGSLIRFKDARAEDAAIVLTNGHCLETGMPKPGVVVSHAPSNRTFWLNDPKTGQKGPTLKAKEILYSTMTDTDITLYTLTESYETIYEKHGIRPLELATREAQIGESIDIMSGYWKRGYSCKIEARIPTLHEDEWTWHESLRYTRPGCEIIGGTSGSPVTSAKTGEVIAINNTSNEDGLRCEMNNPCEVDAQGKTSYKKGYSYAQQTVWINSCVVPGTGLFDLASNHCLLPKPKKSELRHVRGIRGPVSMPGSAAFIPQSASIRLRR